MNTKTKSLWSATLMVSILIIAGKILGFGRVALIAAYFGATSNTDAFFLAQNMPEMIFPAICNSLATAFVPLYICYSKEYGKLIGDAYVSYVLLRTSILAILLGIIGVVITPFIIQLFAPGFVGAQLQLAIDLTRLTMGAFVFTMLHHMLYSILSSNKCYNNPQIAVLFYSITIIGLVLYFGPGQSMKTLTLISIFGLFMQVVALLYFSRKYLCFSLTKKTTENNMMPLIKLALPILLGNSIIGINTIVDKALSSTLPLGSLSALSYSNSLTGLVISVFITALTTVLYPTMVTSVTEKNYSKFYQDINNSLSVLSLFLVPISCITIVSAENIVTIAFGRGAFDGMAIKYTALALACYAPMFAFSGIREVLTRAYFAMQNTRIPAINASIGVVCNVVLSIILVNWFGIAGIALGTSIASFAIAGLLAYSLRVTLPELSLDKYFKTLGTQVIMGVFSMAILIFLHKIILIQGVLLSFAFDTIVGFSSYFVLLYCIGNEDIDSVILIVKSKYKQLNGKI